MNFITADASRFRDSQSTNFGYMRKIPALCGAALLCLAFHVSYAQSMDSTSERLLNYPSHLLSKTQDKLSGLDKDLQLQTEKYLARLARKEQKLRARLYGLDSAKAASLYAQDGKFGDIDPLNSLESDPPFSEQIDPGFSLQIDPPV